MIITDTIIGDIEEIMVLVTTDIVVTGIRTTHITIGIEVIITHITLRIIMDTIHIDTTGTEITIIDIIVTETQDTVED